MSGKRKIAKKTGALVLATLFVLAGCGHSQADPAAEATVRPADPLDAFSEADLSGYAGLANYEKPLQFVDMTVADVHGLLEKKASFAVMATFADCPWCNVVMPYVNDEALEAGVKVGNIDTRKDPSWQSNLDLKDYDLFTADFGDYLEYDEEGLLHLYVPHIFFIRDGEVVYEHQGALPEMGDNAEMELNEEQKAALAAIFKEGFSQLEAQE